LESRTKIPFSEDGTWIYVWQGWPLSRFHWSNGSITKLDMFVERFGIIVNKDLAANLLDDIRL
jgi:hypothetical protein